MKYDFVIFGATGFTGQYVIEFLAKALQREDETRNMTWAVAGRNESKLKKALADAAEKSGLGDAILKAPLIICDVSDDKSLEDMARSARVVLNCVGPYRFFGEAVVRACVTAGAHHVDISGEPQYMERMQLKFHDEAEAKGVYVVSSCGFDSIPADVGHMFLTKKMGGDVNEIETYLKLSSPSDLPGPRIHFATWQSAIYGFAMADELKPLRKKLFPERLPSMKPKLKARSALHFNDVVDSWCLPFPGSDRSVMMRTQRARYHGDKKRPAQIACYMQVTSLLSAVLTILAGAVFGLLAKFGFGRSLLENYPSIFSFGMVSKEGPSREVAENTNFEMTLVGKGWKDEGKEPSFDHDGAPTRQVTVKVTGKNIGYGATSECLVQSAIVLLLEDSKLPGKGGVFTPGYAFANTSLVERLNRNEVEFTSQVKDL